MEEEPFQYKPFLVPDEVLYWIARTLTAFSTRRPKHIGDLA